jgi:FeS assembly SUF system regulator
MLRISKITDYGIVLLTELARGQSGELHAARELSQSVALPLPVVSKTLKALTRHGLLVSHRGAKGGFSLARAPEKIAVAEVIDALEGPVGLTECASAAGECQRESICGVREPWQHINGVIVRALRNVTLADLIARPGDVLDFTTLGGASLDPALASKSH